MRRRSRRESSCSSGGRLRSTSPASLPRQERRSSARRGMEVVYDEAMLTSYVEAATKISPEHPILIDRFLENAVEAEADAIADGEQAFVPSVMEHIELAGRQCGGDTL